MTKRDFSKERMESGIKRQNALDTTVEFLEWYLDLLRQSDPQPFSTISNIEETLMSLGGDINEVCEV